MCIDLASLSGKIDNKLPIHKLPRTQRKKIWNLERRFHCSVAGTCFTLMEMRRFCRKGHISTKGDVSDYDLHINFVAILADARTARPAAKYLDRKYKTTIHYFEQADSAQHLQRLWNEAVSKGEIAAAFWAILTHPRTSETLLFQVYGEVHMLSHLSGASVRLDMQELTQLRQRIPKLKQALSRSCAALLDRTRQKDEIIEALNKRLHKAFQNEKKRLQAEEKIRWLENNQTLRHLQNQLTESVNALENANLRAERAEKEALKQRQINNTHQAQNKCIEHKLLALKSECSALENTLENILSTQKMPCHKIDLAGRCILYVGGRNRLCTHFRTLVEQQNGRFIHHDGGREENPQRLDALLSHVDAVLCPMDCISHDAVNRIKRNCKRNGKHFSLLPHASLSAFTKGVYAFSKVSTGAH